MADQEHPGRFLVAPMDGGTLTPRCAVLGCQWDRKPGGDYCAPHQRAYDEGRMDGQDRKLTRSDRAVLWDIALAGLGALAWWTLAQLQL